MTANDFKHGRTDRKSWQDQLLPARGSDQPHVGCMGANRRSRCSEHQLHSARGLLDGMSLIEGGTCTTVAALRGFGCVLPLRVSQHPGAMASTSPISREVEAAYAKFENRLAFLIDARLNPDDLR